jgi:glutaredoxin 3
VAIVTRLKTCCNKRGITYEEVDLIKGGEQAQELLMQSGQRTVPQLFINKKPIGGFTELSKLLSNNRSDLTDIKSLN